MMDNDDVLKTESRNLKKWFSESFNEATHVIYFISPEKETSCKNNPYQQMHNLCSGLMEKDLSNKKSKKKYLTVDFYNSKSNVPREWNNFKYFQIPQHFKKFLKYINSWNINPKQIEDGLLVALKKPKSVSVPRENNYISSEKESHPLIFDGSIKIKQEPYDNPNTTYLEDILSQKENKNNSPETDNTGTNQRCFMDLQGLNLG